MKISLNTTIFLAPALALLTTVVANAQTVQLSIDTTKVAHPVSPMLYGLMTEEINHSYDGGLYAELLSNHTFRGNWEGVNGWGLVRNGNAKAAASVDMNDGPSKALPTSLKMTITSASVGNEVGLNNEGYWGVPLKPKTTYQLSFYAKVEGGISNMHARLVSDATGKMLAEGDIPLKAGGWSQYKLALTTGAMEAASHNHLELTMATPGTIWLQLASLMPPTYANRANGLRIDLMEKMAIMHPKFVRLPGGNYLEGDRLEDWYDWQKTIGPLVDRPGHQAPWSYWSTDGLGLLEFLEWTEDLKVEPVLAVYAGYALKHDYIKPGKDLEPYVQAALDEVEYTTGDVSTKWGAQRAKDGHPAPFPLHYIEIGNEDWFDKSGSYPARFTQFAMALRKKYPQFKLITTDKITVTDPAAEPDVIDDHYYKSPADMFDLVHKYDDAPRNGMKVFVGEWATRSGSPTPNFGDTLGDAAWMTGLEKNSDLIVMASYAPLLVNINPGGMQWPTDLIGYDSLKSYGSPSYYAQALFAAHLGDSVPQNSISGAPDRLFYSATVSSSDHVLHLKLVNATNHPQALSLDLKGVKSGNSKVYTLHGGGYLSTNSITDPEFIKPVESTVKLGASHTVPEYTIEVIDIPLQ